MQDDPLTTPGFKLPDAARTEASRDEAAERGAKTMTKAELAEALFDRLGLNKREAKDMVDGFFDEIRQALERGESVKLSGFGNFQLRSGIRVSEGRRFATSFRMKISCPAPKRVR